MGPYLRWGAVNVGLFFVATTAVVAVYVAVATSVGDEGPGAAGRAAFALAFIFVAMFPGMLVYLVALTALPEGWSAARRRLAAFALAPVIPLLRWPEIVSDAGETPALLAFYGGLLAAYGLVARVRPPPISRGGPPPPSPRPEREG